MTRTYLGVDVYEGPYDYRGMHIVPTWGGDMFEALMPDALRARGALGRRARGASTTRCTCARRSSTASTRRATATGASRPATTRRAATAPTASTRSAWADGYPSNEDDTFVDHGFGDCRPAEARPAAVGLHQRRRHAARLVPGPALRAAGRAGEPRQLRSHFAVYGKGGFYDAVNVQTGQVARSYLALDQGMVMAAAANALSGDRLRGFFAQGAIEQRIRPLLAMEQFTAGTG